MVMSTLGTIAAGVTGDAIFGAAKKFGTDAATMKAIVDHFTQAGPGGANQNAQNVANTRAQTDYDHRQYGRDMAGYEQQDLANMGNVTTERILLNEGLNNARRQANYNNAVGLGDLQNRAGIANTILNNYASARQANANLMANLATAGITQA